MATLILSTVGTAVAGPLGGSIGAFIGQQIDSRLFAPKGREGPRLNDLRLQTSSYGTPIPRVFGTMRIAGTVIWATDIQEDRNREGGGKGRPSTTTYSYSASFAVALSARPIRAVHRIWADGKLLRGAAGDFKSETADFRLHLGSEDQVFDPLIASAEGADGTPAYRGLALAVFENLQLADFGNRIPSLTFEVEADADAVGIGDIVDDLSAGQAAADSDATLSGYAAHGADLRAAIEMLFAALPHHQIDDPDIVRFSDAIPDGSDLADDDLGAEPGEEGGARHRIERDGAGQTPVEVAIRYYEPVRDYQAGLQRAWLDGPDRAVERIDLPSALSAPRAKAIAEARLARLWSERETATVALPFRAMDVRPGDAVRIPGQSGVWRVAGFGLERMAVMLDLVRVAPAAQPVADMAAPGRAVSDPDLDHGPTVLHVLDLPGLDDALYDAPRLIVAAAGPSLGWRSAVLEVSYDGGASFASLGRTAPSAVMGQAASLLAGGQAAMIDAQSGVEVALLHDAMWLSSASDAALIAGANLALLGDELIQFGLAEPLGEGRFRLGRLLRGRRGTEWAMDAHSIGEGFVLIEAAAAKAINAPISALGGSIEVMATGLGDTDAPVSVSDSIAGLAIRPPAPVHLTAERLADGGIAFRWVRRSRLGWAWTSGSDVPLGEETESWQATVMPAVGAERTVETGQPDWTYMRADQLADGADMAGSYTLSVVQLGTHAESFTPARTVFTL
ncbi:phage tail protein [Parasphingopyxis sp.]|uniref:phage tail protein n=1 Tax=Parasphingopyxis sp. TaxID=1920299 RepID=UPI00262C8DDF|nr:phage tail protein [Parasphingopyxis sp.]